MKDLGEVSRTMDGSLTLYSSEISECYHSKGGALWESEALYIKSSGIEREFQKNCQTSLAILDVGLGLGYNALSSLEAWWNEGGRRPLSLTSLEVNADLIVQLQTGVANWQEGWSELRLEWCRQLKRDSDFLWTAEIRHPQSGKSVTWRILRGDAKKIVGSRENEAWNYIWQDPFSPQKNPEMWDSDWFCMLKRYAAADCRLLTYSVARVVKDSLKAASWELCKIPASGPKKSWLMATNEGVKNCH